MKFGEINRTIRLGIIGFGWRGYGQTETLLEMPDVEITAVCDVYPDRVELGREMVKKARGKDCFGTTDYREVNRREDVDGILVQLPLPEGLDSRAVLEAIRPEKDVDAFHPENVGRLMLGLPRFLPCTPAGIMALLRAYGISPAGKHCVVVGRSNIVGKPMALLLLAEDATVTVCHSRTPDLAEQCRRADILISAVGRRGLITSDMVKPGAVVVDVAMNRNEEGKLCGDVDFAAVAEKAAYITPVPGGVGPMTRAMLMENTVSASRRRQRKED